MAAIRAYAAREQDMKRTAGPLRFAPEVIVTPEEQQARVREMRLAGMPADMQEHVRTGRLRLEDVGQVMLDTKQRDYDKPLFELPVTPPPPARNPLEGMPADMQEHVRAGRLRLEDVDQAMLRSKQLSPAQYTEAVNDSRFANPESRATKPAQRKHTGGK